MIAVTFHFRCFYNTLVHQVLMLVTELIVSGAQFLQRTSISLTLTCSGHDHSDIRTLWTQCTGFVVAHRNSVMFDGTGGGEGLNDNLFDQAGLIIFQWSMMISQHGHPIIVLSGCHLSIVQSA